MGAPALGGAAEVHPAHPPERGCSPGGGGDVEGAGASIVSGGAALGEGSGCGAGAEGAGTGVDEAEGAGAADFPETTGLPVRAGGLPAPSDATHA